MDLEGNDGRERGEDDTNFERQSALFALAVADVLMVNVWAIEIGREHGSGKPLLRTIFQVRMVDLRCLCVQCSTAACYLFGGRTQQPAETLLLHCINDLQERDPLE